MRFREPPQSPPALLPAALGLLLLLLLRSHPAAAYVLYRMDPESTAKLRLFEHVLRHDRAWRLVLDQKVIVSKTNRPAYGSECEKGDYECEGHGNHVFDPEVRELVRLLDPAATEVTAAVLLPRVLNKYAWLGSHVQYAAHVLRTALTCVTLTIVSLQIDLLVMREDATAPAPAPAAEPDAAAAAAAKTDAAASTDAAATSTASAAGSAEPTTTAFDAGMDDQWAQLAVFVDKVAGARGDVRQLAVLAVLLNEFADPHSPYRRHRAYLLRLVKDQMDAAVDRNCVRPPPDEAFKWLGVGLSHGHLEADVSKKDVRCVLRAYDQASADAMLLYDGLQLVNADTGVWKRTLDYGSAVAEGVNFYMRFEETLRDDEVGRQILMEKWRWSGEQVARAGHHPVHLVGGPQEVDIPIVAG